MLKNTHMPVGFWRSVGSSQNAFFMESYIDELAHAGGHDPYKFRRTLLAHRPDFIGVLDKIAEKGDWGKPLPQGHGRGIAIHECYGTIIGQVSEVSVNAKGEVRVHRVVAAVDCGHVVNPSIVEAQIQSGVMFGLSAALYGDLTIKDGVIQENNFDQIRNGAAGRRAEDRSLSGAVGRQEMGRHRRAGHGGLCAVGGECGVCRDRHAGAQIAAEECEAERRGVKQTREHRPYSLIGPGSAVV